LKILQDLTANHNGVPLSEKFENLDISNLKRLLIQYHYLKTVYNSITFYKVIRNKIDMNKYM
jgi:hypothetical protein